jgi:hypothetical protein
MNYVDFKKLLQTLIALPHPFLSSALFIWAMQPRGTSLASKSTIWEILEDF